MLYCGKPGLLVYRAQCIPAALFRFGADRMPCRPSDPPVVPAAGGMGAIDGMPRRRLYFDASVVIQYSLGEALYVQICKIRQPPVVYAVTRS